MNWKEKLKNLKGSKEKLKLSELHDRANSVPMLVSFVDHKALGMGDISDPAGVDFTKVAFDINLQDSNGVDISVTSPDGTYKKAIFTDENGNLIRHLIMGSGVLEDAPALVEWLEENFNSQPGWLLSPFIEHEAPTELWAGGPKGFVYTFVKLFNDRTANVVELRSYDNGMVMFSLSVVHGATFEQFAEAYEIDMEN